VRDTTGTIRVLVLVKMLLQALDERAGGLRSSASLRFELVALRQEAEDVLEQETRRLRLIEGQAEGPEHEVG
jgi:hypothetical protein